MAGTIASLTAGLQMLLFLVTLALMGPLVSGDGADCYECQSQERNTWDKLYQYEYSLDDNLQGGGPPTTPQCQDPFYPGGRITQCKANTCYKRKYTIEGTDVLERGCSDVPQWYGCHKLHHNNIETVTCYCDHHFCNKGQPVAMTSLLTPIALVLTLVSCYVQL